MQRQTQRHNVGVMLTEFQGRSILRKGAYIHAEKIYRELTVEIAGREILLKQRDHLTIK